MEQTARQLSGNGMRTKGPDGLEIHKVDFMLNLRDCNEVAHALDELGCVLVFALKSLIPI